MAKRTRQAPKRWRIDKNGTIAGYCDSIAEAREFANRIRKEQIDAFVCLYGKAKNDYVSFGEI